MAEVTDRTDRRMTNLSQHDGTRARANKRLRARILMSLALPAVLALSACGGGGSSSAGGAAAGAADTLANTTCGDVPVVKPNDPEGLVTKLPEKVQASFNC